jgi:fumarate hydratase subunit beta
MVELKFPVESRNIFESIRAGDEVRISGTVYTARDQAHARLLKEIEKKGDIPDFLKGGLIFYAGPAFYSDGRLSAIGPTTAARMDSFAPVLYRFGIAATLGKGPRARAVLDSCRENRALYLVTYGGAASYLTKHVLSIKPVLYEELGPEAVYEIRVSGLPAFVAFDIFGGYISNMVKSE